MRRRELVYLSTVAVCIGGLMAGTGSAALAESSSGSGGSTSSPSGLSPGQTLSQSQAISSGYTRYSHASHPDGSNSYTYDLSNGITISEITPPNGFNPLVATDQELEQYGFPARPTSADALSTWTNVMRHWKNAPAPSLDFTGPSSGTAGHATSTSSSASPSQYAAGQWAGWYDYSPYPGFYYAVQSYITVPNVGAACNAQQGTEPGIWVGLGGYNSGNLLQSGVAALAFPNEPTVWQPFWEAISTTRGNPPIQFRNVNGLLSIHPLDEVWTQTAGTSNPNSYDFFFFEDLSTGQSASYTLSGTSGYGNPAQYYDGTTAEWMMEFPTGLAPFSSYEFTNAGDQIAGQGTWTPISGAPHNSLDDYGTSLTVGGLNSGGNAFAEFFNHC